MQLRNHIVFVLDHSDNMHVTGDPLRWNTFFSLRRYHQLYRYRHMGVHLPLGNSRSVEFSHKLDTHCKLPTFRAEQYFHRIKIAYFQELLNTAMCAVFYFIAFIIQLCVWVPFHSHSRGSNIAAGVSILYPILCTRIRLTLINFRYLDCSIRWPTASAPICSIWNRKTPGHESHRKIFNLVCSKGRLQTVHRR